MCVGDGRRNRIPLFSLPNPITQIPKKSGFILRVRPLFTHIFSPQKKGDNVASTSSGCCSNENEIKLALGKKRDADAKRGRGGKGGGKCDGGPSGEKKTATLANDGRDSNHRAQWDAAGRTVGARREIGRAAPRGPAARCMRAKNFPVFAGLSLQKNVAENVAEKCGAEVIRYVGRIKCGVIRYVAENVGRSPLLVLVHGNAVAEQRNRTPLFSLPNPISQIPKKIKNAGPDSFC